MLILAKGMRFRHWLGFVVVLPAAALACNAILGIDDLGERAGVVGVDAGALTFGLPGCSQDGPQTITLANPSPDPVTFTATLAAGAASPFTVSPASGTIPAGATATVTITPQPGDAGSAASGDTLIITSPRGATDIKLQRANTAAKLDVATQALTFDQPYGGTSPAQPITIKNSGSAPATVTLSTNVPFYVEPATLTIDANATAQAWVTYAPSAEGPSSDAVAFAASADTSLCGAAPAPLKLSGTSANGVVEIAAGTRHVCARTSTGDVYCWGNDQNRQIGTGTATEPPNNDWSTPHKVDGVTNATAIGLGFRHSCVALAPRGVACWGWNNFGQSGLLPDGGKVTMTLGSPHVLDPLGGMPVQLRAASFSMGYWTSCASDQLGGVYCWGDNDPGATNGDPTFHGYAGLFGSDPRTTLFDGGADAAPVTISEAPFQLLMGATATAFAQNGNRACAVIGGVVECWPHLAFDDAGNVVVDDAGNVTNDSTFTPQPEFPDGGVTAPKTLALGAAYACGLWSDGSVRCWGDNSAGTLGSGTSATSSDTPVKVVGVDDVVQLSAGSGHACALRRGGDVYCWGANGAGELGDGTMTTSNVAVKVKGLEPAAQVVACHPGGCAFSCALTAGGHVWCWGDNGFTQLGQGSATIASSPAPLRVQGLP